MSYLVLARKYRPKTFEQMVGQPHVVQALTNALKSQRLHHAYLFTGTRGVGKTTVSRILAKSLNCETGITDKPCGVCAVCADIDAGHFVDYTELDAASNRSVDEIQQLLEQAVYKPVQGRFKVFMIDEVHMLTGHAFNAMLKTLEEPPAYLKFVLATTDPHKVPVTVLSRCLQFNLRPMAAQTIVEHLQQVLPEEQIQADVSSLRLLARAARGSMRDALSLTDQAIAFGNGRLEESAVREMLGTVDRGQVFVLIEALAQGDALTVVNTCEGLRLSGLSPSALLEDMCAVLQRMAVCQTAPSASEIDADPDPDASRVAELASLMPADETQLLYSLCLHGRSELGLSTDAFAALTMVMLRLLAFKPGVSSTATVTAEKKSLKTEAAPPPAPAPAPSPLSALRPPPATASVPAPPPSLDGAQVWFDCVQSLSQSQQIQAMVRELAMQSQLTHCDANLWQLQVASQSLMTASNIERLQAALHQAGHKVQLKVALGPVTDTPAMRLARMQEAQLAEIEQEILRDPMVQELVTQFDAKIIPGSLKPLHH